MANQGAKRRANANMSDLSCDECLLLHLFVNKNHHAERDDYDNYRRHHAPRDGLR
jgi:hypothetical protein